MKMILMMSMLISIMFLNINNPLIMGLILLIQTLLLIMMMGKIYYSFWFSYVMFLVFIGGLFILFIYLISLIYNNKFMFIKNYLFLMIMILIIFSLNYKMFFLNNYESNIFKSMMMIKENYLNSLKFYNLPNCYINLLLIMYLLLLMIIVVKITNFFMGPIRSLN